MEVDMDVVDNDNSSLQPNNNGAEDDTCDIVILPMIPQRIFGESGASSNGNESSDSKKFWLGFNSYNIYFYFHILV